MRQTLLSSWYGPNRRREAALSRPWPEVCVRTAALILVVILPLIVTPWGRDAYSSPKVHVLYGLTGVMVIAWAIALGIGRSPQWVMTLPELPVWAFLLAVLISSGVSSNARLTFFGAPERYEGLFAIGCYIVLFFVGAQFFGTARGMRSLVVAICSAGVLATGYGLLQLGLPPAFAGEAFIRDWYGALGVPRISSTLGSPIVFGGYLSLLIPLWIVLATDPDRRIRLVGLLGAAGGYAALAATFTRAAWSGAAVGTILLALTAGRELARSARPVLVAAVIGVVAGAGVLALTATPQRVVDRVASAAVVQTGSTAQRLYIWSRTLDLIAARPSLGWGIETLREVFPYDRVQLVRYFGVRPVIIDKAHNDLLQVAVSVGIPGAISYLAVWITVLLAALRLWQQRTRGPRLLAAGALAGVCAYLVQVQFSFSVVALAPIVWVLAGSAAGWEARSQEGGT